MKNIILIIVLVAGAFALFFWTYSIVTEERSLRLEAEEKLHNALIQIQEEERFHRETAKELQIIRASINAGWTIEF